MAGPTPANPAVGAPVGAPGDGAPARFFLDWREPTEKAEHAVARLRRTGTVQPDDLVVSAVWYGPAQPPSRWVTHDDLSSSEKDRLLVVAQQALGAEWIARTAPRTDGSQLVEDWTTQHLHMAVGALVWK